MKYKQLVIFFFFCICLCVGYLSFSVKALAKEVSVLTEDGPVIYSLEIADTPILREKGLMDRHSMPQKEGMLFMFDTIRPVNMWMKNTYIPLDMIFVDKNGIIRHIHENAQPLDETIITCPIPVKYVIELNAGQVQKKQIKIGNKIKII